MTPQHLRLLADLLLPGDALGLPPGSQIPDVMQVLSETTSPIKDRFRDRDAFTEKSLIILEQSHPAEFRALVMALIKPYYESAQVLEAMGWRIAPPQPQGHKIAAMDQTLAPALARVAERKRLWR